MFEQKSSSSMLCPNCGRLISTNSESCYFCGYRNPNKFGFTQFFRRLFGPQFNVIKAIIYFCSGIYLLCLVMDPRAIFDVSDPLRLLSPSNLVLLKLGSTGTYALRLGRWWSPLTAIFLHGGLLHILFNMLWVRQIGPMVEEFYGTARFIIIFVLSGVIGFIASILGGHQLTIGASGSIFGLLGALVYYGRQRGGYFGENIYRQTATWALILFAFGFFMSGIDNFAHGGGFLGGYLTALWVSFSERRREFLWHKFLASALIVATILAFLVNIWQII